jgi:hypothetical protein
MRARAEDRIRGLKDTGLRNLPLHEFTANQIWLELVQLAADPLAWTQHLALTGTAARTWEPKRLRLRLLNIAGRIVRTGRGHLLATTPLALGGHRHQQDHEGSRLAAACKAGSSTASSAPTCRPVSDLSAGREITRPGVWWK